MDVRSGEGRVQALHDSSGFGKLMVARCIGILYKKLAVVRR